MISEHFDAVKERLVAEPALSVFDSLRRDASGELIRDSYAVLYGGGPDDLNDDRYTAPQQADSTAEFVYTVRSISVTADGARAVSAKVTAQLVRFTPVITGRKCDPIRLTQSEDVQPDTAIRDPLYFCDQEFTLRSSRA